MRTDFRRLASGQLPDLGSMLQRGHRMPLRWHDERNARLGVMPRHGGDMRWFSIAPCFIQHVVNAFNEDERPIVLDAVRYPWFLKLSTDGTGFIDNPVGVLWRYRLDLASGTLTEGPAGDGGIEWPRIREQRTGRRYRYLYAVEQPAAAERRGIVRHDWHRGTQERYVVPPGGPVATVHLPVRMPAGFHGARLGSDGRDGLRSGYPR